MRFKIMKMNWSSKRILTTSCTVFFFLFLSLLFLTGTPLEDWVIGSLVALTFFLGFYIPFLSIRWAYRRLFAKSQKPANKKPSKAKNRSKAQAVTRAESTESDALFDALTLDTTATKSKNKILTKTASTEDHSPSQSSQEKPDEKKKTDDLFDNI